MAFNQTSLAITEGYRLEQTGLRGQTELDVAVIMALLFNINDITGSWPETEAAIIEVIRQRGAQSVRLSQRAYELIRDAENIPGLPTVRGPGGPLDVDLLVKNLRAIGPGSAGEGLVKGWPDVVSTTTTRVAGEASRVTQNQGRFSMHNSAMADKECIGWVRVTDGNPCAFCRLLASRGPVYKSADTAVATRSKYAKGRTTKKDKPDKRGRGKPGEAAPGIWSDRANGFRAHAHCACQARPIYSLDDKLLDRSKQFRDEYEKAILADPGGDPLNVYRKWLRDNPV